MKRHSETPFSTLSLLFFSNPPITLQSIQDYKHPHMMQHTPGMNTAGGRGVAEQGVCVGLQLFH